MRIGTRSPEHKCTNHDLWLVKVGEVEGIDQLMCPVCLYEDTVMLSKIITEQKIEIEELKGE